MIANWTELAAMLTALGILGGIFTGIVYVLIDKRFSIFLKEMRGSFVTKESFDARVELAKKDHDRYEKAIDDIWEHIKR